MRRRVCAVLCMMAIGCGGSSASRAEPSTTTTTTTTTTAVGNTSGAESDEPTFPMATSEFLGLMTYEMLPQVCVDGSPLLTCFPTITASDCATTFAQAMLACGDAMQGTLPPTVDESTAEPVTVAVAQCARLAYLNGLRQAGVPSTADCPLAR